MKYLKWSGISLVVLFVLWIIASLFLTSQAGSLVFNNTVSWAPVPNFGYDLEFIENKEGNSLSVWKFEGEAGAQNPIILYLHGNSGRINDMFAELTQYGDVYSPAYPGYHESEGTPNTDSVYEAALATYDWLVEEEGIKPNNIIIFGHSMGGSPATYVASKRPRARKLVLVNTFSSIQSMCFRDYTILCAFSGNILNTARYAEDVEIPVRHFAYENDLDVPFEENEKLFEYFEKSDDKEFVTMDKFTHTYPDFDLIGTELN